MKPLGTYINGNYRVTLFDDGTKIRSNKLKELIPEKPEAMDILITKRCDMGCPMCHEDAKPQGAHGEILDVPFLDTLLPFTELAIGGGNPLSHPDLVPFLERCKAMHLITNITVHAHHFVKDQQLIRQLVDDGLIYGLGVSMNEENPGALDLLSDYPNAVIHVINGVIEMNALRQLYDKNLKLLILGYKNVRRGIAAHTRQTERRMHEMYNELPELLNHFQVVSFDNLGIQQLDPRRLMSQEEWEKFYMGDDGQYTMYVDLVNREFAPSSTSPMRWLLQDDIKPMFDMVRKLQKTHSFTA